VSGVQPGWTSDGDQIHGAVSQECIEIPVLFSPVLAAESRELFRVGAVDRSDFDSRNRTSCAGVGVSDVSAADQTNVDGHVGFVVPGCECQPSPALKKS